MLHGVGGILPGRDVVTNFCPVSSPAALLRGEISFPGRHVRLRHGLFLIMHTQHARALPRPRACQNPSLAENAEGKCLEAHPEVRRQAGTRRGCARPERRRCLTVCIEMFEARPNAPRSLHTHRTGASWVAYTLSLTLPYHLVRLPFFVTVLTFSSLPFKP